MTDYKDFYELIILGHQARLTPEEIRERFIIGGLPVDTLPPVRVIRTIGCNLIGPACRWRVQGKMTAWSGGLNKAPVRGLQKSRKSVD